MNTAHVLARELKRFLPWHQARLDCLSQLIMMLIQVSTVNLTQLALAFIEECFHNLKGDKYGFSITISRSKNIERLNLLLLMGALAR